MCGIFGIYSKNSSNQIIQNVINHLNLLQHRGKDGCGIGYNEGDTPSTPELRSDWDVGIQKMEVPLGFKGCLLPGSKEFSLPKLSGFKGCLLPGSKEFSLPKLSGFKGREPLIILKNYGLVKDCFNDYNNTNNNSCENNHKTNCCIGHIKYSTSGQSSKTNCLNKNSLNELQPLAGKNKNDDSIIIVHNGNIPFIKKFDTQFILDMIIDSDLSIENTLINIMNKIPVAYCFLIIINDVLYVLRDRYGIRPLSMGEKEDDIYISSETIALTNCNNIREIKPGTIMRIDNDGPKIIYKHPLSVNGICAFELIYFMNPNSYINDIPVASIRSELGMALAKKEQMIQFGSDYIVIGIPNSGLISAKAYANYLSLKYCQLIKKVSNCTNGEDRTFTLINNDERQAACKKKFMYDVDNIKDKKIIIIDDTIVRGNVIKTIIDNCKSCGVSEIHVRIPAPPIIDKCQLGIAIHNKNELIMNNRTINEVKNLLEIDSLAYLSVEDLTMLPKYSYKEFFGCGLSDEIMNFQTI